MVKARLKNLSYGISKIPYDCRGFGGLQAIPQGVTGSNCDERSSYDRQRGEAPMDKLRGAKRRGNLSAVLYIIIVLIVLSQDCSFGATAEIKSTMKIQRMGGYVILINYETHDQWTDNLVFKVYCEFNKGEFVFSNGSMNNVEKGWRKTEIAIPEVMKDRYGYLKRYRVELYHKGILIGIKE